MAHSGVASRRQCEELVGTGQVKINGTTVTALGTQVDPDVDRIELNGKVIINSKTAVYLLLHKPPGYICTAHDPQGRPTILDLVTDLDERIYPVGRLDFDTSGLIILSNDGEFTNLMIHPRYKIDKTYEAWVKGRVLDQDLQPMRSGVILDDGLTAPADVILLRQEDSKSLIRVIIHEGRKRQVKRMCAAIGHPVLELKRTGLAFLSLNGLKEGQYRHLSMKEIEELRNSAAKQSGREKGE